MAAVLASHQALACPVLSDHFGHPDGTSLVGQTGGGTPAGIWTSPWEWTGSGADPGDAFATFGGKPTIGNTGGIDYQVSRGFDLSGATNVDQSVQFTVELTQVTDNHNDYVASVIFSDGAGTTAAMGIEDDLFFGTLGTDTEFADVGTPVEPDVFYWMFGQLDFNFSGQDERLRVWVNRPHSDIANGTNVDVEVIGDLGSFGGSERISLGDLVSLSAVTTQPDTAKTFDDFMILNHAHWGEGYPRLDIGVNAGELAPGFDEWVVGATPQPSFSTTQDPELFGVIGADPVTITVAALEAGEDLTPVEQLLTSGVALALRKDGVEALGGIELVLSDLFADSHMLKTYHHQSSVGGVDPDVDVYIGVDGGPMELWGSITPSTGDAAPTEANLNFMNSTTQDVIIQFIPREAGGNVGLSGMAFVPEPGTVSMLIFGAVGLLGFAWRRRRR